jgi:hypothetical protein
MRQPLSIQQSPNLYPEGHCELLEDGDDGIAPSALDVDGKGAMDGGAAHKLEAPLNPLVLLEAF